MPAILGARSWSVREAANGRLALDAIRAELPDLILLDLTMPEMDGFELVAALQANAAWRAHAMAGDREKALATGCDDFDTKPIEFDRLLAKIEQALAAQAGESGSES